MDRDEMHRDEQILEWNGAGLLAEVVGFETREVARDASGSSIVTYEGDTFIDFTGGIAVHACGHNHPDVIAAIQTQAEHVLHVSDIMRHAPQLELAAWMRGLFARILPGSPWQFLLMNSGSESIDAAAKLALKATGRHKLVAFEGAFHGRTLFASALSRSKTLHWNAYEAFLAPLRANILHAPAPRCAGCQLQRSADTCCANGLEKMLEQHGSEIAAVFLEAQQGEGGYLPVAPVAAQKIRELTRKHGILLIMDEIQSGWGRTGRWFGFQHLDIEPDIVVFGKAVGGGLPLAGLAARQELMERWQPGEHGTTFGGNPLSCAAGLAALKLIERERLVEHAACLGAGITARLRSLVGQCGIVDVRGNGLMIGIELRDANGKPDYARCEAVKLLAREKGLLLLTCGAKIGNAYADNAAIRLIPPLNTPDEIAHQAVDILIAALRQDQK
jgi:4-aminobutyrate aminotransferase-like enzyme